MGFIGKGICLLMFILATFFGIIRLKLSIYFPPGTEENWLEFCLCPIIPAVLNNTIVQSYITRHDVRSPAHCPRRLCTTLSSSLWKVHTQGTQVVRMSRVLAPPHAPTEDTTTKLAEQESLRDSNVGMMLTFLCLHIWTINATPQ